MVKSSKIKSKQVIIEEEEEDVEEIHADEEEESEDELDGEEEGDDGDGDEDGSDQEDEEDGAHVDDDDDDDNEDDDDGEESSKAGRALPEDVVDDLQYDLFNLTSSNYHPLHIIREEDREETLKAAAVRAAQLLVKKLFMCPSEMTEVGPVVLLPKETSKIPRAKRIPEPKAETKWEKFAKEKGIKKQKKERMVFDEATQQYIPRWGYKSSKGGIEEQGFVEVKAGEDPFADPFSVARSEKKSRVAKNIQQQLQNKNRAMGGKRGKKIAQYDSVSVPGIPIDLVSEGKAKRGKEGVRRALQLAQHSTASLGRFDEYRTGEPARKIKGKKRHFKDNIGVGADKENMKAQLRIVTDKVEKKLKGVTNSLSAYEGIIPDAPTDTFKKRKGKGKSSSSDDGGKGKGKGKNGSKSPGSGGTKRKR